MRTWTRVTSDTQRCGSCSAQMPVGAPMLEIHITGMSLTRKLRRCQDCADVPVPDDLPEKPAHVPGPMPLALVRFAPSMLPLDYKALAAADREPGEDG